MSELPHVAHFIPYTGTAMGGPVQGMAAYVGLLAEAGYAITVYSATKQTDGESIELHSKVRLVREAAAGWGAFRRSAELWRQAQQAQIDLLHSHGLWTDVNRLAGDIVRRRGRPHLLAPCGMLAAGALRHHRWKKVPVRFWFQDRALREAHCLHAKSNQEFDHIREFGLRNPVAIIANPISLPPLAGRMSQKAFRDSHKIPGNQKIVLFLGRLHPVKGLPRLLQAWTRIQNGNAVMIKERSGQPTEGGGGRREQRAGSQEEWLLVLAGPDERGHRKQYEVLAAELGCQNSVLFTGELDDNQKWGALAAADLFVMPSDFENFGNAIVESMLSGLPIITTTGTPWRELPAAGAGWWIEPTVEALASALREALDMPEETRREMGRAALKYSARFRPEKAGADLMQVYQWLLGESPRPQCVRVM